MWAFSSSSTLIRIHTICHHRCFLCALTRDQFNTSCASCLCCLVHRTFLVLLPSVMVMWWQKNFIWFHLWRRVEKRHKRGGNKLRQWLLIVVNKNCFFLKQSISGFSSKPLIELEKELIDHSSVNVLWVLYSLSNLLSSVLLAKWRTLL